MGIQPETARDIITLALKEAGVLGVGQTPLAEDVNDCFTLMNRMFAQWQKKRWVVPSLYDIATIGNGAKSNPIGPGQYWNAQRPDKIQAAYFLQNFGNSDSSITLSNFGLGVTLVSEGPTISGGNSDPNAVSFPLIPIYSYENYAQLALKNLRSWPQYYFYDNAFPVGNVYIWPIPDATYEIHLILKSPIGFTVELQKGVITQGGLGFTNGNYVAVPTQNITGYGNGATLDITVAGGVVTNAVINDPGDGYKINDNLTINPADAGGTGGGFIYNVTDVTDDLDAVMNMPSEYYEAIHYNLVLRIMSMYNYPADPFRSALAKGALNTIRVSNSQIPSMNMPTSLRNIRGSNFYIFNADSR